LNLSGATGDMGARGDRRNAKVAIAFVLAGIAITAAVIKRIVRAP